MNVRAARFPEDAQAVVDIFREYVLSPSVDLGFQGFEEEFDHLPGQYAPPDGGLLLAWLDERVVGCAAFRRVNATTCEMKRVYVRPAARGTGLGRRLVERVLRDAREAGYARICLDVLPEFEAAQRLYADLGFKPVPAVAFNPVAGTQFLGMELV
jgi:GNAT superfamily N-acetyltransferase